MQGAVVERRSKPRFQLHCPIQVARGKTGQLLASTTRDFSSSGFYCLLSEALTPGEHVVCTIDITDSLSLRCWAVVLRAEFHRAVGLFGVACQIEEYRCVRRQGAGSAS